MSKVVKDDRLLIQKPHVPPSNVFIRKGIITSYINLLSGQISKLSITFLDAVVDHCHVRNRRGKIDATIGIQCQKNISVTLRWLIIHLPWLKQKSEQSTVALSLKTFSRSDFELSAQNWTENIPRPLAYRPLTRLRNFMPFWHVQNIDRINTWFPMETYF